MMYIWVFCILIGLLAMIIRILVDISDDDVKIKWGTGLAVGRMVKILFLPRRNIKKISRKEGSPISKRQRQNQ